jgi:hypothetical protein
LQHGTAMKIYVVKTAGTKCASAVSLKAATQPAQQTGHVAL